jgi:bacterioferritin-associated ferredoxin
MYICVCRGVTERDIHQAAQQGISSFEQLSATMGVGEDCGCCAGHACQVLETLAQGSGATAINGSRN